MDIETSLGCSVYDDAGNSVVFGTLFSHQRAIVVFVRELLSLVHAIEICAHTTTQNSRALLLWGEHCVHSRVINCEKLTCHRAVRLANPSFIAPILLDHQGNPVPGIRQGIGYSSIEGKFGKHGHKAYCDRVRRMASY